MRILCLSISLLWAATCLAQSHRADLSKIASDGLYKILLPADLRAESDNNFDYLRIKDSQGQEVPYVIMDASDRQYSSFKSLKINSKNSYSDSVSSFIIENENVLEDYLVLKIANTTIDKNYTLYGSDEKEEWFGLVATQRLSLNGSNSGTTIEKRLSIPLNNYRYLRLDFDDKNSIPIKVLEMGVYENQYFPSQMLPLDKFSQSAAANNIEKTSRIEFKSQRSYQVDAITFKIGTEFYLRNTSIVVQKEHEVKRVIEMYDDILSSFTLSSKGSNSVALYGSYLSDFSLIIDNQDNPALEIEAISFYQKPKYLVTYLKAGKNYKLEINAALSRPSYDLAYFISNNINDLKEAQISKLEILKDSKTISGKELTPISFWRSQLFMWLAIGLGGILVIYFAVTMLKDMSKS